MLRDRPAQLLPHWNDSVPGYGYLLGLHAFGLEETANYTRAEDTGALGTTNLARLVRDQIPAPVAPRQCPGGG